RNWQDVMIPMMVETLAETESGESREELSDLVEDFVMRLNGRQTIFQMIQLAEEVRRRGGEPLDPLQYKHKYHDLLWLEVGQRVAAVRAGHIAADQLHVPQAGQFLAALQTGSCELYLASGTDLKFVRDELRVLGLGKYFGDHVYGALDDYEKFSKAKIIQQIIRDHGIDGRELVGFGDGFVEIEEVKRVGGLAVGVASNEEQLSGVNPWKRNRLIEAGADLIIGDYRCHDQLLGMLKCGPPG
ncbi:MAG: HAD family hydrolase, partial [Pirellulaceae bacterium]|nr:HAD family hydrolase [Pirellulaceae bacterium]